MTGLAKRVLVIEDEAMVAMLIEDLLQDIGCEVAGSASCASEAVELARRCEIDFALLDVTLGAGQTSVEAANVLRDRQVPYAWLTGYDAAGLPEGHADAPLLQKPINPGHLAAVIRRLA